MTIDDNSWKYNIIHIKLDRWHSIRLILLNVLYNIWDYLDTSKRESDLQYSQDYKVRLGSKTIKTGQSISPERIIFLIENNSYPVLWRHNLKDKKQTKMF